MDEIKAAVASCRRPATKGREGRTVEQVNSRTRHGFLMLDELRTKLFDGLGDFGRRNLRDVMGRIYLEYHSSSGIGCSEVVVIMAVVVQAKTGRDEGRGRKTAFSVQRMIAGNGRRIADNG